MTKRMLIDDTQPEETRVVVVNGNKIEDVEFESSFRKQIKGNVYLAKVMRIEPSLQAAFVDYGGNRHGFLAFGEIHPDYYHVSDEVLAEYEKEVDTIIENKKQFIREREAERARIREEKALKRAQRLEEEARLAAEIEAARLADEQNSENKPAEENNITEENTLAVQNVEPVETAETSVETTEAPTEVTEATTNESSEPVTTEEKPRRRRGRKPRAAKEADVATIVVENAENTLSAENETTTETVVENETSATVEPEVKTEEEKKPTRGRRRRVKTMAEDTGTEEEKISEEVSAECEYKEEEPENVTQNSANDDDIAVDDDDDGEYDYESQRKLILMRKLFHNSKIQDVIKEGQILLVQVVKEERGNKGAALTTYLSLAGRYCVLMPNRIKSGGVSRKITNAQDRKRLKSIIKELPMSKDMSLIVRTAGEEKTKADITRDYNYLIRTWNQIRHDSLKNPAPVLIYEEGNLIKRALRDMFTKEISEIIVDGDAAYKTARNFMRILSPHNMKKLKSCKANDVPLFQRFQVESQLDKLHDPNVPLESGGYLVINPTEALVSIDVNSGRATKESDLEETALRTNLEAADEIAKQLKMRNLAGLIVIDFIDMDDPKNNLAIEKRMKEAMKGDRSRVQISKMSCFGLLEISRQRMHSSFLESNYQTCPFCHGRGIIRTVESGAMSILRIIEEEGTKNRSSMMNVFVPTDYAVYLLNQKRQALYEIEQRYKMAVIISADSSIKNINEYRVERTKAVKIEEPSKPAAVQPYEVDDDYDETADIQNDENENENDNNERQYRRRERNGRRYRFDRRRGRRERNNEENSESTAEVREETPKAEETEEKTEKRKVSWWKKLING